MDESETEWIRACQAGQRAAFEPLVRRYGPRAYRFALALVRDAEDAKDLSQEAFTRAYVALHRFESGRPFYPWLLAIVRNVCLSHLRRRRPKVGLENVPEPREQRELPPETRMRYEQAFSKLREQDREILTMKAFQDLSYAEISDVLRIPRGTVMSRLYHARRRLKDLLR